MVEISDAYPRDILESHNKFRSLKILVKQQEDIAGGIDELKNKLEATVGDIANIFNDKNRDQQGLVERTKKIVKAKTIYGLALPLPNELNDSQSHQWETSKGFISKASENIFDLNKVGEMASLGGFRKPLTDPGYFQDYNGTEPREFSFSWDLIPNSVEEANSIYNILYKLKKFTLPTSTVNLVSLYSPYIFDIEIGNDKIKTLMNMNNVVCKSLSINYSVDGSLQFFADGTPKFMRLEMQFSERATVTADLY